MSLGGVIIVKSRLVDVNQKGVSAVVNSYKKLEDSVINGYTKIEDKFVDKYLRRDGETICEAKERIRKEQRKGGN